MTDIFSEKTTQETLSRIAQLRPDSTPRWGKMSVAQMLAHCCVAYEMVYTDKHPKATGIKKWLLTTFVKKTVVGPKPYPKNGRTAPVFIVDDVRDIAVERKRLSDYISKAHQEGREKFDGLESNSFGVLTAEEWSTLFYKHLDHHLGQFGV